MAVAGYVYFLTTDKFSDVFGQVAVGLAKPMAVAVGLCTIAVVYIGMFHAATRFIEGVLLLATCAIASTVSCWPLNVIEPDIQGFLDGVVLGAKSGVTLAIVASLWCLKPKSGEERKRLLARCAIMACVQVPVFGAIGWWESTLTGLDFFVSIVFQLSFAVVFVCTWLAAAPTALMAVEKKM